MNDEWEATIISHWEWPPPRYNSSMATTSKEVQALVAYIKRSGAPHRVTATLGQHVSNTNPCDPHSPGSYHCRDGTGGIGLAIDLAEPGPSSLSPGLLRIFAAFAAVESSLAELIYAGAPYNIRDGKRVPPYAVDQHKNHVHVAVKRGVFLSTPVWSVKPMYDPPLQIVASLDCPTGGTWCVAPDGAIFSFGGAPYLGGANGKPYFVGRTAAKLNLVDGKYQIVATSGETYGPGF